MISYNVVHAAHIPERREALHRLLYQMEKYGQYPFCVEDRPGKFYEWSMRVWEGALESKEPYLLFLNDDVILEPDFHNRLEKFLINQPRAGVVNLHLPHWKFLNVFNDGWRRAVSHDGFVGPAYVFRREELEAFLEFRKTCFKQEALTRWPEDAQIATWCLATDRLIYHPVPALIDIDTSVKSCFGHDGDPYARPVTAGRTRPEFCSFDGTIDIGLAYTHYVWSLITHLTLEAKIRYGVIEKAYDIYRKHTNPRYNEEFRPAPLDLKHAGASNQERSVAVGSERKNLPDQGGG